MSQPSDPRSRYSLDDLLYLMSRLRHPKTGCPWDLKQTFKTIVPSTIEEAYEVAATIEEDDLNHLKEELGDLLFQIVFYSQLAHEENRFTFAEVVSGITEKLIRRHPHVFPDGTLTSEVTGQSAETEAVKVAWEAIKQQERDEKGQAGLMDDVPLGLPALTRAQKLQKRAAHVGFDWDSASEVIAKVEEELAELKSAIKINQREAQEEELGDVVFSLVNLARHLQLDAESALRHANNKFVSRFRYVEKQFQGAGFDMSVDQREQMEAYWQEAKKRSSGNK